jgi:hypothetical protein
VAIIRSGTFAALLVALVVLDVTSAHDRFYPSLSWSALRSSAPFVDVAELRRTRQRIFPYQTFTDPLPGEMPSPIVGLEQWTLVREDYPEVSRTPDLLWRLQVFDLPMITRVGTLGGFDGVNRASDNTLLRVLNIVPRDRAVRILRTFGTAYLIGPTALDTPDLEPLASTRGAPIFAYRVRQPAPPAYLASRLIAANSDLEAFNRMMAPDFRPGADVTVSELPAGWAKKEPDAPGGVSVLEWQDERIRLQVSTEKKSFLVLNEAHFPGWEASIDGEPSLILRANVLVRGVLVPPGRHTVDFSYRPMSFRVGLVISLLTLAAVLAVSFAPFVMRTLGNR